MLPMNIDVELDAGIAQIRRDHPGPQLYEWLYVLSGRLRLVLGDQDLILAPGEVAEFDTHVPHWMGNAGATPVELLSLFGPQGERAHVRARPSPNGTLRAGALRRHRSSIGQGQRVDRDLYEIEFDRCQVAQRPREPSVDRIPREAADAVGHDAPFVVTSVVNGHGMNLPPSTLTVWPVMKSASGEARKNTGPTRSSGCWSRRMARAWR